MKDHGHATPDFTRKALDLLRLILHGVFENERATEVCVSVKPNGDHEHLVAIASDCDAFERYYEPVGKLKEIIAETCRTLAVVCRDRAIVHRGAISEPVGARETQHELTICSIGAELRCSDPELRKSIIDLIESLMPPPNIHLEVQGRHLHARAPLQMIELTIDDDLVGKASLTGELHNLPQKLHDDHVVQPLVLAGGIPIGPCTLPYQFNIIAGLGLRDSGGMLPEINRALRSRMPSPLPEQG